MERKVPQSMLNGGTPCHPMWVLTDRGYVIWKTDGEVITGDAEIGWKSCNVTGRVYNINLSTFLDALTKP